MSKHVALTYIPLYIKINGVLLTDVLCLYVITLRDGKLKKRKHISFYKANYQYKQHHQRAGVPLHNEATP